MRPSAVFSDAAGPVGKNAADAAARRQRKEAELNAVSNGVAVVPDSRNGNAAHRSAPPLPIFWTK